MRPSHALNGVLLLLILWQTGTWLFAPPRYILPSPADVAAAFLRQPGFLFGQAMVTFGEMAVGLFAGVTAGILVAFTIAAIPRLGRLVWP
ncbi:MAG: ABC transporter permease, partial [Rhizobium oryzihabitans]